MVPDYRARHILVHTALAIGLAALLGADIYFGTRTHALAQATILAGFWGIFASGVLFAHTRRVFGVYPPARTFYSLALMITIFATVITWAMVRMAS